MMVLIVENNAELGALWVKHLNRIGLETALVTGEDEAMEAMRAARPDVVVIDLDLPGSGALAVADYAAYRHPAARVILVTASSFFSDGSIFTMNPNVCAFLPARTPPEDLAAVVEFHGSRTMAES